MRILYKIATKPLIINNKYLDYSSNSYIFYWLKNCEVKYAGSELLRVNNDLDFQL
jgi:hypothetical protein